MTRRYQIVDRSDSVRLARSSKAGRARLRRRPTLPAVAQLPRWRRWRSPGGYLRRSWSGSADCGRCRARISVRCGRV